MRQKVMSKIMSYLIEGEELGHLHYDEQTETYVIDTEPVYENTEKEDTK
jgi:hypothetical protein|tara:strand:+ start:500 stop:646 length:147 start_codon:yes stop_codon:yes gene_type:complete